MDKVFKKGEIWLVNFEPSRKGELGKKSRPSIIIQNNLGNQLLDTITLVPLTSIVDQYDEMYVLIKSSNSNGLSKSSIAICSHLYSISKERFSKKIGILSEQELASVLKGVSLHLGIGQQA